MYQVYCDDYLLYDPRIADIKLLSAKCNLESNTVCEGALTILHTHPNYDKLKPLKSIFEIRQDGHVLFRGRMTNNSRDFHKKLEVDLEGVLAFANDTIIPPFNFPGDFPEATSAENIVEYFLGWILEKHNEHAQDWQQLKVGTVTVTDPNNYITRSSDSYSSTWETLKSKLFESSLGGHLYVRYEADGNYVDYVNEFEYTNTQRITLDKNILDITAVADANDTYSAILPTGAEVTVATGNDYEGDYVTVTNTTKKRLTLEDLPDGNLTDDLVKQGNYIYSKSAVAEYGWICAPPENTVWDDVTDINNLKKKAMEYIAGTARLFSSTVTITAVDLSFSDEEIQAVRAYRNVIVDAPAHGFDNMTYPLPKLEIDILNPQNTVITIGDTRRSLVDINSAQQHTADTKISSVKKELIERIDSVAVNGVDIGARNFLRKTDSEKWFDEWAVWQNTKTTLQNDRWVLVEKPDGATSYGVILPRISNIPSAGKYILSFDAYSNNAVQLDYVYIMKNGGNMALQLLIPITAASTRYEVPVTLADSYTDCGIMIGTKNGTSFYVRDIMLSSGNTATDWIPAPEDFDERLNDSVSVLQQTMLEQRTAVMNDCEKIFMSALESYVETGNYTEFKKTVESQLSIMADEISMNFTHTTENISNVSGDLQSEITDRKKHITFSENGIIIGSGENTMALEVDNDMISFKKNGVQFGWWDGVDFHTGNIMVDVNERAQFGNFAFVPRSDGSLMFLKVGG